MAWFLVGEQEDVPAFLTHDLLRDVRTAALRAWTPEERVAAVHFDAKLATEADALIRAYLCDWLASDRAGFEAACVQVRLEGEAAQCNAWEMLACFFGFQRCGFMRPVVDAGTLVLRDMLDGDGWMNPMGRVFEVHHYGRRETWWDRVFPPRTTALTVRLNDVRGIQGTLRDFVLAFDEHAARFTGSSLQVVGNTAVQVDRKGAQVR